MVQSAEHTGVASPGLSSLHPEGHRRTPHGQPLVQRGELLERMLSGSTRRGAPDAHGLWHPTPPPVLAQVPKGG